MKMPLRHLCRLTLLFGLAPTPGQAQESDPKIIAKMQQINSQLRSRGLSLAVEQIEFFTIGGGRPSNRIHQQPFRWVADDERRLAQGDDITYLVDQSDGATASGLTNAQTEPAIDRALDTWDANRCFGKVEIVKRADSGADPDIFDSFCGFGGFGNPFLADIVNAGWLPRAFLRRSADREEWRGILAFSVTFIFTDDAGNPTDIDGNNRLDSALNEVYYNNTFGDPACAPSGRPGLTRRRGSPAQRASFLVTPRALPRPLILAAGTGGGPGPWQSRAGGGSSRPAFWRHSSARATRSGRRALELDPEQPIAKWGLQQLDAPEAP